MTTTSTPLPPAGTYRIDASRSTVSYSGRHLFGTGAVHATFAVRDGELHVAEDPARSTVRVSVDPASFASDRAKRDADVKGKGLLDVATYPDITFTADALEDDGSHWVAHGEVTAHGTTVPVDVVVDEVRPEGDELRLVAHASHLDRCAFGITGSRGMVGRHLDLGLDVVAVRS